MSIEFIAASTEYIACGSGASIDDVNPKTVTFWIFLDDISAQQNLATKGAPGDNTGWQLAAVDQAGTSDFKIFINEGWATLYGGWDSDNNFSYGTKYHVAITYDSSSTANNAGLYIDGVSEALTENSTPAGAHGTDAGQNLVLGVHSDLSGTPIDGKMEDFRVFPSILTVEPIAMLAAGYRGPMGGEVMWLSMNEATGAAGAWEGTSLANGTNLLPDLSVNSNNGDPTNTPTGRASEFSRYGVAV